MTTKKYTVTLPEELAEAIRADVGPGGFSRYVAQAIERKREQERLGEAIDWWESEYGPVSEAEMAEAAAERQDIERRHAELSRESDQEGAPKPARDDSQRAA
ncbi:hypothetical protein [Streptomyces oceani]|uniref:CopG family transcriptional regulator n=1 Tax=Streptomyces oceani TaxID=1075402 RepID=A0A1E7JZC4_9ACTN|nr:hypothetical protein [Streptomyces oceani]OEU97053.1 hypothetical protein AN216_17540 [Streptomyces oceani]